MANVHCVFFKFCVFFLIFVKSSQSNQIKSDPYNHYTVENSENHLYHIDLELDTTRVKRDTSASLAKQTIEAPSNVTVPTANVTKDPVTVTNSPHLLGENGAGQRKDYSTVGDTKPSITAINPAAVAATTATAAASAADNDSKFTATKNLGSIHSIKTSETEVSGENKKAVDTVDESDDAINKTINEHLTNSTQKSDYYQYYNSTAAVDKNKSDEYWSYDKNYTVSNILSKSHRRAITVALKFDFPFYGHPVRNVTVATGGFLYTGEYVHSWLAATQYIAPLMANFDTSISNVSTVKYADNGTAFTVIWENVPLQDTVIKTLPLFTFSVTLYNTGDITFAYKNIPMAIEAIKDEKHPVKIGLSDAYIIDKTIYFARRKTIYEYHRVNFNGQDIKNDTLINLIALPTCLKHTDCNSCIDSPNESFNCTWCPALTRCSTGTDRKRQEWIQNGCERTNIKVAKTCPALGSKGNNYASQQQVTVPPVNNNSDRWATNKAESDKANNKSTSDVKKAALSHTDEENSKQTNTSFAVGILLPITIIASLVMWVFYAYRNPHTKSGQLLIQYRPSQWSWRRGEARYTAATIHM